MLKILPVNKAILVRSSFSSICETCGQVNHDEARAIRNQKYKEKVNLKPGEEFLWLIKDEGFKKMTLDNIVKYPEELLQHNFHQKVSFISLDFHGQNFFCEIVVVSKHCARELLSTICLSPDKQRTRQPVGSKQVLPEVTTSKTKYNYKSGLNVYIFEQKCLLSEARI